MSRRAWPVQQGPRDYTGDVAIAVTAEWIQTNFDRKSGHCEAEARISSAEAVRLRDSLTDSLNELAAAAEAETAAEERRR